MQKFKVSSSIHLSFQSINFYVFRRNCRTDLSLVSMKLRISWIPHIRCRTAVIFRSKVSRSHPGQKVNWKWNVEEGVKKRINTIYWYRVFICKIVHCMYKDFEVKSGCTMKGPKKYLFDVWEVTSHHFEINNTWTEGLWLWNP